MNPVNRPFAIKMAFSVSFLFVVLILSQSVFAATTIQGTVYDRQRNVLPEIDVELLNDYYQLIQRARTDGSGRFTFNGVRDGRHTIRVLAFRYDFYDQEATEDVMTQQSVRANANGQTQSVEGSGFILRDFYLVPKKGGLRDSETGVVFAQEVPKDAQAAYRRGIEELSKKKTVEGLTLLLEAIQKFDKYFEAYLRVGKELYIGQKYLESVQYLLKATEINPKSADAFYFVGLGLNKLGKEGNKSSVRALSYALTLAPQSVAVLYALGRVERQEGKFADAETHLLKAKELSTTKSPDIHIELSQLYANDLKKYDAAASELELYLKSAKFSEDDIKKTRQTIADLREKAKQQAQVGPGN